LVAVAANYDCSIEPVSWISGLEADAGDAQTVDEDETVNLLGNGTDTASDISGLTYFWEFGNGNNSSGWSSSPDASTIYTAQGEYTATLTVKDDNNATDNSTVTITVKNVDPVAKLRADKTTVDEDESIRFDAERSTDTDSDIADLEFIWQFEDEDYAEHPTRSSSINHTFTGSGDWDVKLTVIDDDDAKDSAEITVRVENLMPIAKLYIAHNVVINPPWADYAKSKCSGWVQLNSMRFYFFACRLTKSKSCKFTGNFHHLFLIYNHTIGFL